MPTKNKTSYAVKGLLCAAGVFTYVVGIAWLFANARYIFGEQDPPGILAPVLMLLTFIISATITGSLVLGAPIYLYLSGHKKDASVMLCSTLIWLVLLLFAVATFTILL